MKLITSAHNKIIKDIKQLHRRKGRQNQNKFIAEGIRTIEQFYSSGLKLHTLLCTDPMADHGEGYPKPAVFLVTDSIMNTISTSSTPCGLLAVFAIPETPALDTLSSGIVAAQINDPGNLGTLIRTTAAMGYSTVVIVDSVDPWSPKVVQASTGTLANVKIFELSWEELLNNQGELELAALVVSEGESVTELDKEKTLLVVGNEAHGISPMWIDDCKHKVTLPMPGKTESLNASIAAAIALYTLKMS